MSWELIVTKEISRLLQLFLPTIIHVIFKPFFIYFFSEKMQILRNPKDLQSISPTEDFIQIVYLIYTNKSSFHTKKTRNVSIRYSSLPAACDSKFLCYFNFCIFTTFPATVFLKVTFLVNLAEFSSCNFSFLLPYFESVSSKQSGTC